MSPQSHPRPGQGLRPNRSERRTEAYDLEQLATAIGGVVTGPATIIAPDLSILAVSPAGVIRVNGSHGSKAIGRRCDATEQLAAAYLKAVGA